MKMLNYQAMDFPNKKSELRYEAWQRIRSWLVSILLIAIVAIAVLVFVSFGRDLSELVSFSHTPDEILTLDDTTLYAEIDLSSTQISDWKKVFSELESTELSSIERLINDNVRSEQGGWIDEKISVALLRQSDPVFFVRALDRREAIVNIEKLFGASELVYPRDLRKTYQLKNHGLYYTFWQNYLVLSQNSQNLRTALNPEKKSTLITDAYYKNQKSQVDNKEMFFVYFDWDKLTLDSETIRELAGSFSKSIIRAQIQPRGLLWQWREEDRQNLFGSGKAPQSPQTDKFPTNTKTFISGSDLVSELDSAIITQTRTRATILAETQKIKDQYGISLQEDILPLLSGDYAIGQTASGWLVSLEGDGKQIETTIEQLIAKIQENYAILNPVIISTVYSDGRPIEVLSENPDPIQIQSEAISGVEVRSFPLSSLPVFAYAQLDDSSYLLANSTGAIALGIQAWRGQIDSLEQSPHFSNLPTDLIEQNSLIYLEDFDWVISFLGLDKYQDFFDRFQSISISSDDQQTSLYLQSK